jgi:hypothetical protein
VTTSQLHAIYLGAHADATRLLAGGRLAPEVELACTAGLSLVEQVIATFAFLDATNGTPPRSRARFERSLEGGSAMLRQLQLRGQGGGAEPEPGRRCA